MAPGSLFVTGVFLAAGGPGAVAKQWGDLGGEFLDAPDLVERVADDGNYVEVRMVEDADLPALLRRAVDSGARISRFELVEPSLRSCFDDLVVPSKRVGLEP